MKPMIFAVVLLFLQSYQALNVDFSESDFNVHERETSVRITLTASEQMGDWDRVMVEVVPVSLKQYRSLKNTLPSSLDGREDPAEPGLDFDNTTQYITIRKGDDDIRFNVSVTADDVREREEVFLLLATVHKLEGTVLVKIKQDTAKVVIKDSSRQPVIWLSQNEKIVSEGDGMVNNQLYLEIDGQIEPTVSVSVQTWPRGQNDIVTPKSFNFSSRDGSRIPIPLDIIDDNVVEMTECIGLILRQNVEDSSLYRIDYKKETTDICIEDNDVPRIGFRLNGTETNGPIELTEGDSMELCVSLLGQQTSEVLITATVSLSPDSPTGIVGFNEEHKFKFDQSNNGGCFEVGALDNEEITASASVILTLHTEYRNGTVTAAGDGYIQTEPVEIIVRDNDGVPVAPINIRLKFRSTDQIHISWEAVRSEVQPIDNFVVIVQATPKRGLTRSKRQLISSSDNHLEYETKENFITIGVPNLAAKSYSISVCAVNHLGRKCSVPQRMIHPSKGEIRLEAAGLTADETEEKEVMSPPLVLAISVVVPAMLLILCIATVCAVAICKHCGVNKSYYPARQGIYQDRLVLGSIDFVEAKYCKRASSTDSSLSMEWTQSEPRRVGSTLSPLPLLNNGRPTGSLGTPV